MKNKFKGKFIAPLRNFECDFLPLNLFGDFCIRKISGHEENHLTSLRKNHNFIPSGENKFVLEVLVEQETEIKYDDEEARRNNQRGAEAIGRGIKILRLFKSGLIGFDCILKALSDISEPAYTSFYSARYLTRITGEFKLYKIKGKKEIKTLKIFWKKYFDLVEDENIALRWFNKSYHEFYNEDRLLDLVFAIENIYLKGDKEKQSLRYKFAVRAACYLAKSPQRRKLLYNFLSDIYKYRNRIAHGDEIPLYNPHKTLPELEDVVRKSLKKTLIDQDYYKSLDDNIFIKKP